MRLLRRYDLVATGAVGLALAAVLTGASYAVVAYAGQTTTRSLVALIGFGAVAGCGLLYASRLGAGGLGD